MNASSLSGKEILLGVTGGIAAYKAVLVLRELKKAGAEVTVIMTRGACAFVQPLTFQTLSNRPVGIELFDLDQESRIGHIAIAERAELALVAPCTAHLAAKLRAGLADDLLSTVLLATRAPIHLALAMNDNMLRNAATQENLRVLEGRGVHIIPPETGFLAEGREGPGRLAEPAAILAALEHYAAGDVAGRSVGQPVAGAPVGAGSLAGRRVLITAGPTREALDPVRYLSNHSSGRMGFAIAEACRDAGAAVTLISGPVRLADPPGVETVRVTSATEMHGAVMVRAARQDAFVLAAAVADYRARETSFHKIKRAGKPSLVLELVANPDIAAELGAQKRAGQAIVVFAAESQDLLENAQKKMVAKNADLVVANDITEPGSGFESAQNRVTLLRRARAGAPQPPPESLPLQDKRALAARLAGELAGLLGPVRRGAAAAGGERVPPSSFGGGTLSAPYTDRTFTANGLRHHLLDWGNAAAPPLVLVHGFTRQAHVFDPLCQRLRSRFRCIAVDIRGRGQTEWGKPEDYHYGTYVSDLQEVFRQLGLERFHWFGTSMGGKIAMTWAATEPERFLSAVFNDIGPESNPVYAVRTKAYLEGHPPVFPSLDALIEREFVRFPWLARMPRPELEELYRWNVRWNADGTCSFHFDPAVVGQRQIGEQARPAEAITRQGFAALRCPILVFRGSLSDTLTAEMVEVMRKAQPGLRYVEVEGVGHTPEMGDPRVHQALDGFYGEHVKAG
ncbi:MAG: bifunctional phosphopantothenoylcysteine decarboxylase/phosphopantothenate--cysteine ligase CoaBC [Candidatus Lambdaproteobacteria bacterium]|nr:bifunctional phosphopantothenoylcysteine decarboxylase/phosphopantothenate--cysteine ligase CoaBC [Candidatus Lambdaproteobacteria bacterium]